MRTAHPFRPPPPDRDEPLLDVAGIEVRYGGIRALTSVSLHVRRGEVVALIGANGAGKTTTLRSLVRVVPWSAGRATFNGVDLSPLSTEEVTELGISLVPEGRAIFPNLTVRENLEIGAYLHRNKQAMQESLEDVVKLFPRLGERLAQEGGTLSGGEQQMLAIGRAVMARPSLLLLDEPSLGIAPKLARQIFEAIRAIAASGVTVLVVEQNTRLALEVAARGYVLRTGEVAKEGASKALLDDPEVREAYLGGH
ncbi:MAG: ABC transporter ATP-binding protein [Myxococcales bacterium]|nr:ABC transporter ATP-binding protein [Myxococcales bacterium]